VRVSNHLHRVTHVQAILVPQDAIVLTIGFLVKFKRSFRAPRMPELGEAMVAILDFLSPQNIFLNYVSKATFSLLPLLSFSNYAGIVTRPFLLYSTNQK
jgi:hypothetical protein